MSRVVHKPERPHRCDPGWRVEAVNDTTLLPFTHHSIPPDPWDYPRGTVWECDCGRRWVSTGAIADNMPGVLGWKPEGRIAAWRRRRLEQR